MQLSPQTLLGIRITSKHILLVAILILLKLGVYTVKSFVELVKYIFTIPGVKFFLSEKISQDPIEKFFGCQRQRGLTNENPTAHEMCKNTQALRVINTVCRNVTKGNTSGNPNSLGEEENLKNQKITVTTAEYFIMT